MCLIPEGPFTLAGLLRALREPIARDGHAVIVVAKGAGQDLLAAPGERDASGNVRYGDIGLFLKEQIPQRCRADGLEVSLKYIDPRTPATRPSASSLGMPQWRPEWPARRTWWSASGIVDSPTCGPAGRLL